MKRPSIRLLTTLIISLLLFTTNCGEESTGPSDGGPYGPDEVVYDVEYTDNTVVYDSLKKSALVFIDTNIVDEENRWHDELTYVYNSGSLGESPAPGQVIIFEGENVRKVVDVRNEGADVVIKTEPAILTDVIKNGNISWDVTPQIELTKTAEVDGKKVTPQKVTTGYEYKFSWGNNDYTIWVDPKGTSQSGLPELQVNFIVENKAGEDQSVTATFGAKGAVRLPRQSTSIDIQDESVSNFTSDNSGSHCELTLEFVATWSPSGGTYILQMPHIMMKIPVQSFTAIPIPIPMFIEIGLGFHTYINLPSVEAFANAKTKLTLDSKSGFQYSGISVDTKAKAGSHELGEPIWAIGDLSLAPVGVELRHDVSVPRVAINILGQEVAWASSVLSSRTKLIVPSLCKAQMCQVRIEGGYKFEVLGNAIAEKTVLFWSKEKTYKTPECP